MFLFMAIPRRSLMRMLINCLVIVFVVIEQGYKTRTHQTLPEAFCEK